MPWGLSEATAVAAQAGSGGNGGARPSRGRATEAGMRTEESERESRGCVASSRRVGEAAGRQEVEASGTRASTRLCLLAEIEDDRFGQMGWAASWNWARWLQVSGPGGLR